MKLSSKTNIQLWIQHPKYYTSS